MSTPSLVGGNEILDGATIRRHRPQGHEAHYPWRSAILPKPARIRPMAQSLTGRNFLGTWPTTPTYGNNPLEPPGGRALCPPL